MDLLVDSSSQIRALTLELSTKSKLIEELKGAVQSAANAKPAEIKRDEDLSAYLTTIIKKKD